MNMIDVGRMPSEIAGPVEAKQPKKKMYPTLYLDNAPDELMEKPMGHVCRLTIVVKVKGHSVNDGPDGERKTVDLEVQKVGYASAGQKTKDEYLGMKPHEREEYDKSSVEEKDDDTEPES